MRDMSAVIVPKSDQWNADDLISGPRTITITKVTIKPGTEQPVAMSFEGDEGKVYRPCKSMSRVLVYAWGPDAKAYTGRSLTLYRDPDVTWAGMKVGGIRISHMSHIERDHTMALTVTKQSRKPFTVKPLRTPPPAKQQDAQTAKPTEDPIHDELAALEGDDFRDQQGRVEDDRQAEMLAGEPANREATAEEMKEQRVVQRLREWTKDSAIARGKEIAAAMKDHGGVLADLDGVWQLYVAEILTMPAGARKGLETLYDEQRAAIEGA